MARPTWHHILLFLSFLSLALAASPTSFCKCTCFSNSTIIPLSLTPNPSKPKPNPTDAPKGRTCIDCNKQFCLSYHLPICKDAKEEDVFTTCFQRDSRKDELVVFIFIFAAGGLLVWAAVRPWVLKWREGAAGSGSASGRGREYVAVSGEEGDGGPQR